jgi:D-glycero-D-manno-heptose 1,7-bisphosphate phosphatase
VSTSWSIFLDRDGVINELLPMDYVKTRQEFVFKEGVLSELAMLSNIFDYLFIITNQQGVGKGLMTEEALLDVHNYMMDEIQLAGGRISKIYYCPHIKELDCNCRKPKPGMVERAFEEFPEATPQQSIFVGDSSSDIELAESFGITSVGMLHAHNRNTVWQPRPAYMVESLTQLREEVLPLILEH